MTDKEQQPAENTMPELDPDVSISVGVEFTPCEDCHEYKIAMAIARSFSWASRENAGHILGFDRDTEEITIEEAGLLRIIQMMNPDQTPRKIRLV